MKKKLILFDWGNIVESHTTGYSCYDAWNDLFKECGYLGNEIVFYRLGKYKLSSIKTIEEFKKAYEEAKFEFNFNKTFDEFVDLYRKIFSKIDYYKEVADYEISLRDRCYIGLFSNLTIFDKERLARQVELDKYDYVFLSFELGLRKPDIEIYKIVEDKVNIPKEDILFIDDRLDNIETAKKLGWNTFQTTGLELDKIKEKCEEFLSK